MLAVQVQATVTAESGDHARSLLIHALVTAVADARESLQGSFHLNHQVEARMRPRRRSGGGSRQRDSCYRGTRHIATNIAK